MKKNQTNRLSKQHKKSKGPKGIFGESAQQHDVSVRDVSISVFETLPPCKSRIQRSVLSADSSARFSAISVVSFESD